jgi:hypothetical protein
MRRTQSRNAQVDFRADETERSLVMNNRITSSKILLTAAAAGLFFAGCFNDPDSDGSGDRTATIEGRVQGDMALAKRASGASAGVEGAAVTVLRIQSDGSFKTVSTAEVKTDAQGRFSVKAAADDVRELVVSAKKEGKEWKAVVSGKAKQGAVLVCRPLDTESSVEADVLAKARAGSKGEDVSFADIASHIDADMSMKADGKADVEGYLAAQVRAEAEARIQAMTASAGKITLAQIAKAEEARMDAEAKLESDLDAAADLTVEAKAKIESDFRSAELKAWSDAGIVLGEVAKARESSFQAMISAGATVSVEAETKLAWLRKVALDQAATLEASAKEDAQASGGNNAIVVEARAALEASLGAAKSEAEIDSAFSRFHASLSSTGFSLSGKVEGGVSGADVRIATIQADGSLEFVGTVQTKTDAEGGFTLKTDAKLPDSAVVVVTQGDAKLMVLLDSTTAKPVQVGTESTVETKIVQQLIKDGKGSLATSGEIKAQVDSNVAAGVKGDDSAIVHLIAGMDIAAKAQSAFLIDGGFGSDVSAQDAEVQARSLQVYAQALARFTVGVSSEAKFALIKNAHAQAAHALRTACEAQVKAAGAVEASVKTLAEAGVALQASVEAAVNAEAIASAYAAYHASVVGGLKSALVLQAAVIESVDGKIRAQDGARAELMGKIDSAADAAAAAKAHLEFSAEVEAQVKSSFGSGLGAPTAAQVKAVGQAMVLADMCG